MRLPGSSTPFSVRGGENARDDVTIQVNRLPDNILLVELLGEASRIEVLGAMERVRQMEEDDAPPRGLMIDARDGRIDVSSSAWLEMWEEGVAVGAYPIAYLPEAGLPAEVLTRAAEIARENDRRYRVFNSAEAARDWLLA